MTRLTKDHYGRRWSGIQVLLREWDPVKIMGDPKWDRDAYNPLAGLALQNLECNASVDELASDLSRLIEEVFATSLPQDELEAFAHRLKSWFAENWAASIE